MRGFLTALCIAVLSMPGIAWSQSDSTQPEIDIIPSEPYVLGIGAQIGIASGGIATENAEGRKVNPDFWFVPTYGAVIYAPFGAGSKIGGRVDIGVSTTGTRTRPYEYYAGGTDWEGYFIERYTMFTIAPQFNLSGFTIGVGFNFPMKAERWNPDLGDAHYVVDTDLLASMSMDIRLGGMINVWKSKIGTLFVDLGVKYFFGGVYNDDSYFYGTQTDSRGIRLTDWATSKVLNLTPASAHLGIAYLFNLGF